MLRRLTLALLVVALPATASADPGLSLEVDKSARQLTVWLDGQVLSQHPVAVGEPRYQTPSGRYAIRRVDWNPDWTPPKGAWARKKSYTPPGHPNNPLGRVRMPFRGAYALHGTKSLKSLGRAASHGCIRVANDVVVRLAPLVMEHGGAPQSEAWVSETLANPKRMRQVPLPAPVPIHVHG